jgi:hypothetical protein
MRGDRGHGRSWKFNQPDRYAALVEIDSHARTRLPPFGDSSRDIGRAFYRR